MGRFDLRYILLIPLVILILASLISTAFQYNRITDLKDTFWIRVDGDEDIPSDIDPSVFSLRRIDSKGLTIISTLEVVSNGARSEGFEAGDLDFYGRFEGGRIVGMTHYKASRGNCTLDLYSPTEMWVADDYARISGFDLLPLFKPDSCQPWPQSEWSKRNFTLYQVERSNYGL